jgi:hypothetical protein
MVAQIGGVTNNFFKGFISLFRIPLEQWFPKSRGSPLGGAQEIFKGGAKSAKLFYSLKINKKHKYN